MEGRLLTFHSARVISDMKRVPALDIADSLVIKKSTRISASNEIFSRAAGSVYQACKYETPPRRTREESLAPVPVPRPSERIARQCRVLDFHLLAERAAVPLRGIK